jgi:hypothetical protein
MELSDKEREELEWYRKYTLETGHLGDCRLMSGCAREYIDICDCGYTTGGYNE